MPKMTLRWTVISTSAALTLAACSGGADPSPSDQPEQGSVAEELAAPPGSATEPTGQHRGFRGHHEPGMFLKHFDKNQDGKLELTELPDGMQARLGKADANGDGVLTADEMSAAHNAARDARFAKEDKDGDGALSAEEVGAKRWERLSAADADKNGSVTQAEMSQAMASGALRFHGRGGAHHGCTKHEAPTKS